MSCNIDSSEYISGKLRISKKDCVDLIKECYGCYLPEECFLLDLDLDSVEKDDDLIEILNPSWSGMGSGYSYEGSLQKVLSKTKGRAIILFIWEGGDNKTALKVDNGKVTKGKVKITVE